MTDAIARLPLWRGFPDIRPLKGGLTNQNFIVADEGRKFVVRLGGDIPVHGIVRTNELAASRAAHSAGVGPAVVHAEPGILVIDFIDGHTFTAADVCDPGNVPRLADLVSRCHRAIPAHLRGAASIFWVFHIIRNYAHTLRDEKSAYVGRLPELLKASEKLERAVGPIEIVFGHNDLLAANIIDDGSKLWLVDWEHAGFGSPLFDLAGLASNSQMPPTLFDQLLELYFGRPLDDDLRRRALAMTAASLLRETMWSMVSETRSAIDFDYVAYTTENFARFERAYATFVSMEHT